MRGPYEALLPFSTVLSLPQPLDGGNAALSLHSSIVLVQQPGHRGRNTSTRAPYQYRRSMSQEGNPGEKD